MVIFHYFSWLSGIPLYKSIHIHQFNGHELGQTLGDGEGQGSLACCCPWDCKESDMTWGLSNNNICMCVYIYVCIYHIFFIHLPIDVYLGCFHIS